MRLSKLSETNKSENARPRAAGKTISFFPETRKVCAIKSSGTFGLFRARENRDFPRASFSIGCPVVFANDRRSHLEFLAIGCNVKHHSLKQFEEEVAINDSPIPLFWSISRSFLMLSSRACSVCFCVSILNSSSYNKKRS